MSNLTEAKDSFELLLAVCAFIGVIYQISKIEKAIYDAIDTVKDTAAAQHGSLEKRLDVHLQDYVNYKEMSDYMINGLNEKLDHKYSRLYSSMRDMEKCLQKSQNFKVREYFDDDSRPL